jgi:TonB family protein
MLTQELYEQIDAEERKYARRASVLTLIIFLFSSAAILVYDLVRDPLPPPGEKEYEVLGSIDFGNYTQGSKRVNNFQPPVENPVEQPQESETTPQPEPTPQEAQPQPATPAEVTPTPTPEITSNEPQEVTAPDNPPVTEPDPAPPTPPTTVTPTETQPEETTNDNQSNTTTTQPTNTNQPTTNPSSNSQSGSNHGDAETGTGNAGTPDVKTLDPNGLYSFGQGSGGLGGRGVLSLDYPQYSVNEEGVMEFRFRIEPNGTVSYATTTGPTTKLGLKQAGINAIKKWKFTSVPGSSAQWVTVKITFKLK